MFKIYDKSYIKNPQMLETYKHAYGVFFDPGKG